MDLGRYMSPHYEALSWMLDGDLAQADNLFTRTYDAAPRHWPP